MTPKNLISATTLLVLMAGCQTQKPVIVKKKPSPAIVTPPTRHAIDAARRHVEQHRVQAKHASVQAAVKPVVRHTQSVVNASLKASRVAYGAILPHNLPTADDTWKMIARYEQPRGALSLGSTSGGKLLGAAKLPLKGKHHQVVARAVGRKTNFGTPLLVEMILDSAKAVSKRHKGSKLAVGNLSYEQGGDIKWSVSHNSGRDADLAFYVKDSKTGKRITAPDLLAFDEQGKSLDKRYPNLIFDAARNWTLAQALLQHPKGQIQYLFISNGLKQQLIEHAIKIKAPKALIERAKQVLKQPTDSLPHNDHFHLRITCPKVDRLLGCVDRGPQWSWVDWYEDDILAQALSIQRLLRQNKDAQKAMRLLDYLHALGAQRGPDIALEYARSTQDEMLQKRAMRIALSSHNWSGAAIAQTKLLIEAETTSLPIKRRAYRLLRRSLDEQTSAFVKTRVANPKLTGAEKALAINALSHHMERDLVPFLLDQLESTHLEVRQESARVLKRITNREDSVDWSKANTQARRSAVRRWRTWWDNYSGQPRDVWLTMGFKQQGINEKVALTLQGVEPMLALLPKAQDHTIYNINKTLRRVTGRWSSLEQTDGKKLHARWSKWWRRNRKRLRLKQS